MNWWRRLRARRQLDHELDAELRFHVEAQISDDFRRGVSEQEARRRARRGLLIQTPAFDPGTLASVVTLLIAVALTACFVPSRRAARLDPVAALPARVEVKGITLQPEA